MPYRPSQRICERCGAEFTTQKKVQRFCSHKCACSFTDEEAFLRYVIKTDTCWLWTGHKSDGYGSLKRGHQKSKIGAHCMAYKLYVSPLIPGMHIHHICNNPGCVNPAHLQQLTRKQHARFSPQSLTTHCPKGHEYNSLNTYIRPDGKGRECKQCQKIRIRAFWAKQHS